MPILPQTGEQLAEAEKNWELAWGDPDGFHADLKSITPDWNRYMRVLDKKGARLGGAPVGNSSSRGSMTALSNYGQPQPQRYGFSGMTNDEVNSREYAPTFEQQRQGQIIAGMDARTNAGLEDERKAIAEQFDIGSGRAAARAQGQGDIARDQARQNARSGAQTYFDPNVRAQREDAERSQLEGFKARYSDPAVARAQATVDAATIRSNGGIERESLKGLYDYIDRVLQNQQSGINNRNDNAARIGAGVVAGRPGADMSPYMPQDGTAGDPGKILSMQDFQDYMRSSGKTPDEAFADLQAGGYRLAR